MAKKSISTTAMTYDEWLNTRRKGIGGSDVGAILGFNKWGSPLSVYESKIGLSTPEPTNDAMTAGIRLEPVIAEWFQDETSLQVQNDFKVRVHPKYDFLIANIDRLIRDPKDGRGTGVLEIKTASDYAFKEWEEDGVPMTYFAQLQHYLYVTGHKWGMFAILVNGRTLRTIPVDRDEEYLDVAIPVLHDFWNNNVLKGIPPEPLTEDDIKKRFPKSIPGTRIELTDESYDLLLEQKRLSAKAKEYEKKADELKTQFKALLGNAEAAVYDGNVVATFKSTKDSLRFDADLFKAEWPDLFERYRIAKPGHRTFLNKLK